ncbi:unnamed protein product [Mytilus edulis]|uniref:Nose resistant-to-fluoxetine protein N-terminal domain-containing protein n=1 Tax=Mytilus edulis TaxID=6550 RepID=A0A8S3UNF3_MYTED|nr:unnamed protein product [Mytilus edulis]
MTDIIAYLCILIVLRRGSDLNVIKSPIEYGKLTRMLSNVTDLRTISCYHFSNIRSEVHESNVTAVPPTESTSKSLSPTVSDRCLTGVSSVVQAVAQQKIWAFKMIDAAGKPPANLLGGGFKWLGDYDECMDIKGSTTVGNNETLFGTEYCMLSVINLQAVPNVLPQRPKWEKTTGHSELHAETAFIESEKTPLIHHDETDSYSKYTPGMFGQLLLSFSVYTNGSKILNTNQPGGSLTAINGIRFISMTWVILGHAYGFILSDVDNVGSFLPKMIKRATFPAISNALVSVDTFFVLRLTPPYMLVLMVHVSLFPYIGSGPVWKKDGAEYNYCTNSWYYNLLYINNFFEKPEDTFLNLFGWLIAGVSACAVLYGVYEDVNGGRESREISSFYITVHRTVWGAAVAWVIFACAHGYGGNHDLIT